MLEPTMTIAGKPAVGKETFPVVNPANGEVIGNAPECTADLLDVAVTSAHTARESWQADPSARSSVLLDLAAKIENNLEELAATYHRRAGQATARSQERAQ